MKRKREESGFALLLVFLLAAAIAIGLYIEMPRVAFESQRQREQLLISRGEQYKRAIQLYYRKYHTYPQNLDDLETTKNIRFLRRRYKDPMTGKEEWRLIHMGPGGMLTDSLVTPANANPLDPNKDKQTAGNTQIGTGLGDASGTGPAIDPATGQPVNPGLNMAARRPSDRTIGNGPEQPVAYNQDPNQQPGQQPQYPAPGQPQYPGQPMQPQYPGQPVQPQYPGQPVDPVDPNQPGQPTDPSQPGQPQYPSQPVQPQYPGQPGYPQPQPQYPGQPGYPQPQYPGQPQYPQPQYPGQPVQPAYPLAPPPGAPPGAYNPATGQPYNPNQPMPYPGQGRGGLMPQYPGQPQTAGAMPGAQGQNQATSLINNILMTARQPPGGMGLGGGGTGLAGVASTAQGTGIHIVNDRKKYKEWEFIYDLKNDKTTGVGQLMQQQQQMMQQQGAQGTQGGAFGSQSGQGAQGAAQSTRPPNE